MWDDELKAPHTAHTSNPVPVILCDERFEASVDRSQRRLAARRRADDAATARDSAGGGDDGRSLLVE